jgi:triacylglycerol lipase
MVTGDPPPVERREHRRDLGAGLQTASPASTIRTSAGQGFPDPARWRLQLSSARVEYRSMNRVPVILHHGLFGYDAVQVGRFRWAYFQGIDRALRKAGHPLVVTRVHPCGGIARRAQELKNAIEAGLAQLNGDGRGKVIILGHSMGGLDARYLITKLGMADRVAALLTVTTPHRGSPYADWCVRHLGKRLGGFELMDLLGLDVAGVRDLTTDACAKFNETVPDAPGVAYFSVSAAREWPRVAPFILHSHRVISDLEGENDGLVSVKSAVWGQHLCTWRADHFHTINKRYAIELRNRTGNIAPYYVKAVNDVIGAIQSTPAPTTTA